MCSGFRSIARVVVASSALALASGLSLSSCQTGSDVTGDSGSPAAGEIAESPTENEARAVPSTAGEAGASDVRSGTADVRQVGAPPEATPSARPIDIHTKRTAAGLPDALPGYLFWHKLDISEPLALYYVYFPTLLEPDDETIEPPFPDGTIVLQEAKQSADDFIRTIRVASWKRENWSFSAYEREHNDTPFVAADPEKARVALEGIVQKTLPINLE